MKLKNPYYAINAVIAGIFGALGSILGKLSGSFDSWFLTLLFFIAMIISNTLGCVYFAKSLNMSSTSLQPTLISTASNYLLTALFGVLFYNERTGILWWSATTLIFTGIMLVSHEKKDKIQ